ncbi:Zinc finger C2HC domain-containing protein 1A [Taenia solium]|eukprot:TsM_000567400 transcript=TsM_000567400 gene=TsM_000567400
MKASKRKPKIFDSGKMRAKGTGIPISKTIRPGEIVPREPNKDERLIRAEKKRDNWRIKHREFINTIRSAKAYQSAASKGGSSLSRPLPPPTIDPDLIQCQYCNRRFNESAAERHIPFCKEKSEREKLKQMANRSSKKPNQKPAAAINSTYQRKSGQVGRSVTQQPPKSPATPKGGKGDGSLSNTTRSLESPTAIRTPAKRPSSRSSSQKRSTLSSANAERGTKNRGRYDDFNSGYLHDKPHSPPLSSDPEDACNSTFDVEDSQHQLLDYVNTLKNDTNRSEIQPHMSGDGNQLQRSQSSHSVTSRGAISRHSSINTNGSTRNISSGIPKDRSPPFNNNSPFLNQAVTLRTGRTYQHYMDAQAFRKDLVKSQSPLKNTASKPIVWPKRAGPRMPPPLIPEIASLNIKKTTRIYKSLAV